MKKFYDTCYLLNHYEDLENDTDIVLSGKTIEELESIKTSNNKTEDIRYRARQAVLNICKYKPFVQIVTKNDYADLDIRCLEVTNDNLIINSCWRFALTNKKINAQETIFYTDDYLCALIAKNHFELNVETTKINASTKNIYTGFKVVTPTDEELSKVYEEDKSDNIFNCLINEYVIINDCEGNFCDVLRWTGDKYARIWNKHLRTLAFGDKLKAKDIYQRIAIDSLINNQMTCISGKAGSGKSLLSLMAAMYLIENGKYDRLVVLFNPCSVRGTTQMGYYAGNVIEKACQNSIGHILISKFGEKYAIDNYIAQGKIKLLPMADCRGCEISDNEILWITEAENTTSDLMKICLSRVSSGAKVYIEGDFEQTDNKLFDCNNGMARAIEVLKGEKEFGYVQLQNIWRSRIAELVDKF